MTKKILLTLLTMSITACIGISLILIPAALMLITN